MPLTYPLTHFEELMLHQDSNAFPTNCFVRMRFRGRLDERGFRAAALVAVARHPLLHARVQRHRGRYRWQVDEPAPEISWCDGTVNQQPTFHRLNLESEHGLKLAVCLQEHESELMVQFHHACCDGLAIFQVVHELLLAYAMEIDGNADVSLPEIDLSLLQNRGSLGLTAGRFLRLVSRQAVGLRGVWQFLTRKPSHLLPHRVPQRAEPAPLSFPSVMAHHFEPEVSTGLRRAAKRAKVTQNDLLIRDLFLALEEFRRAQGVDEPTSWLRLMIPVSLRQKHQYQAPAANIVSSVFLDRRAIDMEEPEHLLQDLSEEMGLIKRRHLNYLFLYSLWGQRILPRGLERTARPKRCQTTVVFTNLSRVFARSPLPRQDGRLQCGDVVLMHVEAIPPIARHLNAALGVSWYANQMTITLHHDPRAVSHEAAGELLGGLVRRMRESAKAK
ncbi:chromosome condensation protein [Rhodopirellula sp. P2]|uniref:chromosome condensation protein n=1 Tax=Rhodopirellula sp. P2 TaxID=2127060 RepID=UPI0023684E05|nr:chromosome condensation protein [Rhodopirellula sp. P2]WDQ17787.1 chromosome condensation protein [Rhodopirellula sp. P2]